MGVEHNTKECSINNQSAFKSTPKGVIITPLGVEHILTPKSVQERFLKRTTKGVIRTPLGVELTPQI